MKMNPTKKQTCRRYETLTKVEKDGIYFMTISGNFYSKEVQQKYGITALTHRKVMNEIRQLYTRTPY